MMVAVLFSCGTSNNIICNLRFPLFVSFDSNFGYCCWYLNRFLKKLLICSFYESQSNGLLIAKKQDEGEMRLRLQNGEWQVKLRQILDSRAINSALKRLNKHRSSCWINVTSPCDRKKKIKTEKDVPWKQREACQDVGSRQAPLVYCTPA